MGDRKENVLLLSMSTLVKCDKPFKYEYKEDGIHYKFTGYSQLEVGTKVVLNKLLENKENKYLDRIIIIHSKECEENFVDAEKIKQCNRALRRDDGYNEPLNANSFYKNRIINYCSEPDKFENDEEETWNEELLEHYIDIDAEKWMQFVPMYKEEKVNKSDKDNKDDKDDIYACLPDVCDRILGDADPEDVNLWVDTQGGRRNETFVMNCVVNTLRIRGVKICEYLAVDFDPRKSDRIHPVLDVTLNNVILDLVSGMDMFISVGRADKLKEYYEKYKKITNAKGSEYPLINKISEVADAIAVCNMGSFSKKLKTLSSQIEEYQGDKVKKADPVFKHLIEDMKESYGVLLDRNHRISDEIKWCMEHKLYQQALTLTEAQLPGQIFEEILSYNREEVENKINSIKNNPNDKLENQYKYNNLDHLVFGEWQYNNRKISPGRGSLRTEGNIKCEIKNKRSGKREESIREESIFYQIQVEPGKMSDSDLKELIKRYGEVKSMRNSINHGDADVSPSDVKKCINAMLSAAKCRD